MVIYYGNNLGFYSKSQFFTTIWGICLSFFPTTEQANPSNQKAFFGVSIFEQLGGVVFLGLVVFILFWGDDELWMIIL